MKRSALALGIFDSSIDQVCILRFVRRSEKQRRIRRGILEKAESVYPYRQNMPLPVVCTRQSLFTE